jgi:hypothetical protein
MMPTQDNAEINSINARMLAERIQQAGPTELGKIFQEDTANEAEAEAFRHKMEKALATHFPNPELVTIPVSEEIYLQYDEHDTWFAVADRDELSYDRGGSVLLGYDDLDGLLKALRQLRAKIKADETTQPEFMRQFGLYEQALEGLTSSQVIMVALSLVLQEIDQNPFLNALVIQLQARGGYSPIDVTKREEEDET